MVCSYDNLKSRRGKGKHCTILKNLASVNSAHCDLSAQGCAQKSLKKGRTLLVMFKFLTMLAASENDLEAQPGLKLYNNIWKKINSFYEISSERSIEIQNLYFFVH